MEMLSGRGNYPPPDRPQWPLRASDALVPPPRTYAYDVALSFAGEDREVARIIAYIAQANGLRVFFDEYHLWEMWGKDLSDYLGSIYDGGSRFCVILISRDYCQKPYTVFERRTALAHALQNAEEYILPVVLDDSWPPGLPRTTAYLDLRTMRPTEVADVIIRKIKGKNWPIRPAEHQLAPKFEAIGKGMSGFPDMSRDTPPGLIEFADVAVVDECRLWSEGEPYVRDTWSSEPARWTFRGGFNMYEDPIFDITVLNRSGASRLITRIGIEAVGASFRGHDGLGSGPTESVLMHRTYQIPVPDLWLALAEGERAAGHEPARFYTPWAVTAERASCRLPDPILVDPGRAYRFGLHLFDYTSLCPTEVELVFWAQTDQGEAKSEHARLSYFIGSDIPPLNRYLRILYGPAEVDRQNLNALRYSIRYGEEEETQERTRQVAYSLWKDAGRPDGKDQEFWAAAERKLGETLRPGDLDTVHRRTL
jgi:TIR domain/Protein of unknown function (DUF2934)